MKLTELMGNTWKDKGDRTSNRLFAVGNDPFDRDLERLQKLPDFLEQGSNVPLRTAE